MGSKYVPTGRPRGRPRKAVLSDNTHGQIGKSTTAPFYREHWKNIYSTPVVKNPSVNLGDEKDPLTLDLKDLYVKGSKYPPEQKLFVVTAWVMTGSLKEAARLTGTHLDVVQTWKKRALWWDDAVIEVKRRKQEELDGALSELVHGSVAMLRERIETGNPYLRANGEIHWVPLTTRDILFMLTQTFEKRALIRGDPTSRTERTSSDARLEKLQKKMLDAYAKLRDETSKIKDSGEGDTFENKHEELPVFDPDKIREEYKKYAAYENKTDDENPSESSEQSEPQK